MLVALQLGVGTLEIYLLKEFGHFIPLIERNLHKLKLRRQI